jgi:hypothetical protein
MTVMRGSGSRVRLRGRAADPPIHGGRTRHRLPVRPAVLRTLLQWRLKSACLWMVREAMRTVQGWGILFLLLISAPSLWHLVSEGAIAVPDLDPNQRTGALLVAHIGLTLAFIAMLPASLGRAFLPSGEKEPLNAHPWVLPEVHLGRVISSISWISIYLLLFLYLTHLRTISGPAGIPVGQVAVHAGALLLYLFTLGLAVALLFRPLLANRAAQRHSVLAQRLLVFPFLAALGVLGIVPGAMAERTPELLSDIGTMAQPVGYLLQSPLAVLVHLERGELLRSLLWLASPLPAAVCLSFLVITRAPRSARELPLDLWSTDDRQYDNLMTHRPSLPARFQALRLFWIKDAVIPCRRDTLRRVQDQMPLLVWMLLLGGFATWRHHSGASEAESIRALVAVLPLLASGYLTMQNTLPGLGIEGRGLRLLRPVLRPWHLLLVKLGVAAGRTLPMTLVLAGVVLAGAFALSLPVPSVPLTLAGVMAATSVLLPAGIAVGFLLPDFLSRSVLIPGASLSGKLLFSGIAGVVLGAYGTGQYLVYGVGTPVSTLVAPLAVLSLAALVLSGLMARWAIHRLDRSPS